MLLLRNHVALLVLLAAAPVSHSFRARLTVPFKVNSGARVCELTRRAALCDRKFLTKWWRGLQLPFRGAGEAEAEVEAATMTSTTTTTTATTATTIAKKHAYRSGATATTTTPTDAEGPEPVPHAPPLALSLSKLPWETTEDDVRGAVAKFGDITRVELTAGPCVLRGTCLVEFAPAPGEPGRVAQAVAESGKLEVLGRRVSIDYAPDYRGLTRRHEATPPASASAVERGARQDFLERAMDSTSLNNRVLALKALEGAARIAPLATLEEHITALNVLTRVGEGRRAIALHDALLRLDGASPSRVSFGLALSGAGLAGDTVEARRLLDQMQSYGIMPDTTEFLTALQAASKQHSCPEAMQIMSEMTSLGLETDEHCLTQAAQACSGEGECITVTGLIEELDAAGAKVDERAINAAITSCETDGDWDRVIKLSARKHEL